MTLLGSVYSIISSCPVTSFVSLVTSILVIILAKLFYTRDERFHNLSKVIPGPHKIPLFGNTFDLLGPPEDVLIKFAKWNKEFGPRVLFRVGSFWMVHLAGAKDLEKLLSSTTEIQKSVDYDNLIPWLGEGLIISKGKKWSNRRKMLTPAFHFKILEEFIDVFNEQSMEMIKILKENFSQKEKFDVMPYITRCTLEIICETAMGVKMNGQRNHDSQYLKATNRVKELQLYRGLRPWLDNRVIWNLFSYGREEKRFINILHSFTDNVIQERKAKFLAKKACKVEGKGKQRLALLDLMFEAQQSSEAFDDDGIREETNTFIFGGHDTTATATGFTIFHIGNHPEVQKKVQEELQEIFGNDKERPVTAEDLTKLKYLECCIKESMRLTSPVPMTGRCIKNEFELEKDVILPPETLVVFFPFQLHRDPTVFESPLEYKPERFFPENSIGRHPFAFLPFSAGPRNCIGQKFAMMEEKILLANIFRNLKVDSCEKLEDLTLTASLILHSESGINVKINAL